MGKQCLGQDSLTASPLWGGGGCAEQAQVKLQGRTRRQDSPESTVMPGARALQEDRGERDQAQLETIPGSEVITWGQGERMMQAPHQGFLGPEKHPVTQEWT